MIVIRFDSLVSYLGKLLVHGCRSWWAVVIAVHRFIIVYSSKFKPKPFPSSRSRNARNTHQQERQGFTESRPTSVTDLCFVCSRRSAFVSRRSFSRIWTSFRRILMHFSWNTTTKLDFFILLIIHVIGNSLPQAGTLTCLGHFKSLQIV